MIPLATIIRPKTLDEVFGQQHLTGCTTPFRKLVDSGSVPSMILYGPPGTGKSTIAEIIGSARPKFMKFNATTFNVGKFRKTVVDGAVVFFDELYRATAPQSDTLLPLIESGKITLIGATLENPFHSIRSALLSRCQIFVLEPLKQADIIKTIIRAIDYYKTQFTCHIDKEAAKYISVMAGGDARKAISIIEACMIASDDHSITMELAQAVAPSKYYRFTTDDKYDWASMLQGAIQASDPDAAVWALAKSLESGEDPRYIARRICVSASEDAFSNPICAAVAHAAYNAACNIGRPECDIILSQAVILIAQSKRDKTAANAIWAACKDVRECVDVEVPKTMKDSHYPGAQELGCGAYCDGANQAAYMGINKKYVVPLLNSELSKG
jgi:putative ATPase